MKKILVISNPKSKIIWKLVKLRFKDCDVCWYDIFLSTSNLREIINDYDLFIITSSVGVEEFVFLFSENKKEFIIFSGFTKEKVIRNSGINDHEGCSDLFYHVEKLYPNKLIKLIRRII